MFNVHTYPVLKGVNVPALVEDNVEDDHDQQGDVEGRNGRLGMKISHQDEHPGGKYQNPRYTAQCDSH